MICYKTLLHYGDIINDNQNEQENKRTTIFQFDNKYYTVVMQHGKVISIKEGETYEN